MIILQSFIWMELVFVAGSTYMWQKKSFQRELKHSSTVFSKFPGSNRKRLTKQGPLDIVLDVDKFEIDELDEPSVCEEVGPCLFCTPDDFIQFETNEVCEVTGRKSKFVCRQDIKGDIIEHDEYRSCKKTSLEDEYSMMKLQIICFMTAIFSLLSVRKQKQLNATLFDQRPSKRRQSSDAQITNVNAADEERGINLSLTLSRSTDGECERLVNS